MKILKKKERGYRFYSETYDLNGAYAGQNEVPIGVLLLYILIKDSDVVFNELSAEAEGELGEPHNILHVSEISFFTNDKELAETFSSQELVIWELIGTYKGTKVYITGRTYGSVLSVRTPLSANENMIPLMSEVESATYEYHNYDSEMINVIGKRFKMNQKVIIQTLMAMEKHKDVFEEFINGVNSDSFVFPNDHPVVVAGYTAKNLFENYPLSEIGAYNYLIYLREDPKAALSDLKKGLPRK